MSSTTMSESSLGHGKDVKLFQKDQIIGIKQRKHLKEISESTKLGSELLNALLKTQRTVGNHHLPEEMWSKKNLE